MSSLKDAIEQKRRDNPESEVCVVSATSSQVVAFIEFLPSPHNRLGFGTGQLLHYQLLSRKPDLADDPTKPPQTLTLGFATADVVITGKRLEGITELLVESRLLLVRALSERFAELNPRTPFVTKIEIKPVKTAAAEEAH